jgi:5-methylcytosine-specific restriction endonuclease McrA
MTEQTYKQTYYQKNKEKLRAQQKALHQKKKLEDPEYMEKRRASDRKYYSERGGKQVRDVYNKTYQDDGRKEKRRQKRLQEMRDKLGGKCVKCGTTESLQFDHKDPRTKCFNVSPQDSWEKTLPELYKCQLLCSSCHLEKTMTDDYGIIMEKKYGKK